MLALLSMEKLLVGKAFFGEEQPILVAKYHVAILVLTLLSMAKVISGKRFCLAARHCGGCYRWGTCLRWIMAIALALRNRLVGKKKA